MKKVGIVSCYFKDNYGSMLQAYATKKVLDKNAIPNETINIEYNNDFKRGKRKYYLSQITNFKFLKNKLGMIKLKIDKKINKQLGKNISIRTKKYKEFRKEFNLSRSNNTFEDLTIQAKELYSDVIVGSDQLWLPVNVVSNYYTLNWVPENINKISYSTSFGFSSIPNKYTELYKIFLNRINHLSTREESGIKIIKDVINKEAKLVCDPTILLTKDEWHEESNKERRYKEKYILCYFLGNNIEHRKFAERLKEKTGYKIVSLNHADEYVKYSDEFCDYAPFDIGPREWISLIENAEYICTDSFHGTVFSILFNKEFFDFRRHSNRSKVSTNSRIDSLLDVAGINKERILVGNEDIEKVLNYKIDYSKVNENMSKFRKDSQKWLLDSISWTASDTKHIDIKVKEDCCGCMACKNICPVNAIEMKEDKEGFLYPVVDEKKCIKCGLCKKVCPIINIRNEKKEQHAYIFQNINDEVRRESTSGGAFSAIAENIIDKKGIVYGVIFDSNFNVIHKGIERKEELYKFRNSKYVQSNLKETFKDVKTNLDSDRWVCFSGTSCQIEGLKNYLGKEYEKLLLVDVVCRAVPSPLVWRKYLKLKKEENKDIKKIYFRDKIHGYKYSNFSVYNSQNNLIYNNGVESDQYLRAFFSNICDRPSCYNCKFKKLNRESDLTLWDCFNVEKYNSKFDDDKGTTRILTNTSKGKSFIEELSNAHKLEEIDVKLATDNFLAMFKSVKYNSNRNRFFADANELEEKELFDKYFSDTFMVKTERIARKVLLKTGMYKLILNFGKKIRKRD